MPQSTNLNKSPYYDDFSSDKNYYKVLFKPGNTVQARELTTLQSVLQNQIETFGNGFFSNGGQVVPGGFIYDENFTCVEIESYYKGINVEDYFLNLVGKKIKGKNTGIKAKVVKVLSNSESERETTTLYITYLSSSDNLASKSFTNNTFDNGEELITLEDFPVGNSFIFANSEFARVLSIEGKTSTSIGSAAKVISGIYFIRGYFVNVKEDILILDQYSNTPSYRVGFEIIEEIIDSNEDSSLNDNAQGFSNFAAPGADRLKISTGLIKKPLTDFNDENFIEIFRIDNGNIKFLKQTDKLAEVTDILARRTFDESGNYYINPFSLELVESLNNYLGNKGYYNSTEKTPDGSGVSENLALLKVSPGKAYIKGYEISAGNVLVDYPKPRSVSSTKSSSVTFSGGDLVRINNVKGIPNVGLTTTFSVSLLNKRLIGQSVTGLSTIGFARVYDVESHNTSYESPASQFNLYMFDIQTYTIIDLSSEISSLIVGSLVKGSKSGAFGYVKSIDSSQVTLYQVSGKFLTGEEVSVDEIDYPQTITSISDYSIDDVKSIFNNSTGFVCDTLLSKETTITGPFTFSTETGIGAITKNDGGSFAISLKLNDVIKYSRPGINSSVYVGVTSIFATNNKVNFEANSTVQNVCSSDIGVTTSYQVENITIIRPQIIPNLEGSSLYSKLNHENISEVKTDNSNIYIKVKYDGVVKSGTTLTLQTLTGDYTYSAFDEERYIVVNANGSIENLTNATFTRTNGNRDAEFTNLSAVSGPCTVITTQIKSSVNSKFKKWNRCQSLEISNTKYATPANAGLAYTSVFGTRVEDSEISLNYPDIIEVHGIFESSTDGSAKLPWITLSGLTSPNSNTSDLIVGELVVGQTSGAVAVYVEAKTNSQAYVIYKNDIQFARNETVKFQESGYESVLSSVNVGDKNILSDYIVDNGQRKQYYDFGRLIRKNISKVPSARLKVYFDYFSFESTDYGDVISANSYPKVLYSTKIPSYDGIRNTDIIDVRPRVTPYNSSTKISPFEFSSRVFTSTGSNALQVISTNEDVIFDYDFYLPRIDKLTLDKEGNFNLVFGEPSEFPITPPISEEVLDIATIIASPYVFDITKDVKISLTDNKRFTMRDIRNLESRISNLEYYTNLSLLEIETKDLLIEDENGLNRFKSGFFVDDFSTTLSSDTENINYRAQVSDGNLTPTQYKERIDLTLYNNNSIKSLSEINLSDTDCSNVKLTGSSLSINYSEFNYVSQNFSSRVININPFSVVSWAGRLQLNPISDTWTVQSGDVSFIRPRNIEFITTRLKPNTRFNLLFDSFNMSGSPTYAFPKLLEIENVRGSFEIGETVLVNGGESRFRVCTPNHKSGPHNNPSSTYPSNPYNPEVGISTLYGPQSTLLNIDTSSLELSNISNFYGNIRVGNTLVGQTSKAQATVKDVRLISDNNGVLVGSISVPNTSSLRFSTGSSSVQLIQSSSTGAFGEVVSSSSATFTSRGQVIPPPPPRRWGDPIAQSFIVSEESGIFPSSVEVYFSSKDASLPVTLQIREVVNGFPAGSDRVVGNLEKTLLPTDVKISNNGTVPTKFTFDSLTKLNGGQEYAIVLISDSFDYNVWISRIGEEEISTINNPEIDRIVINKQPSLGSLFTSQNSSTWTAVQTDDLKFNLNRCKFSTTGSTAKLYNSKVNSFSNENLLPENPIFIGIGTTAPNDGYYMLVNHPNHNMHSGVDKVVISGIIPDYNPEKLTIGYGITESGAIGIASTSIFERFEGNPVGEANPGYALVNNEIIRYTGVSANTLIGITRGFDDTNIVSHPVDSLVYKYEFNNISLRRINKEHIVSDIEQPTIDNYYIRIEPQVGSGTTFLTSKFGGGSKVYATRNKNFSEVNFNENFIESYVNTNTSVSIRTVSGTSVNGSEISFDDQGYSTVDINGTNKFKTIRTVLSDPNETQYLNSTEFIGNKSLTLDINLFTSDDKVSPIIDLNQAFLTCNNYRINQPIDLNSYVDNGLVNSNVDDPHAFIHITKRIDLQESASSLKIIFDANRPPESDIRVLYKIFRNDSPEQSQVWELFPGYDNLDVNLNVVNQSSNSGRSDINIQASRIDEYLEYEYSVNNLADFTGFAIKIVGSTNNQALVPTIRKLRAIALK